MRYMNFDGKLSFMFVRVLWSFELYKLQF